MVKDPGLSLVLSVDMRSRFNMVLDNKRGYIYLKPIAIGMHHTQNRMNII